MGESSLLLRGVFRNGVIVPEPGTALPDGTAVAFRIAPEPFSPEEAAEFAGWEAIGDEAWAMIDEWEKEGGVADEAR